ncbi:DUF937 domain-containing protein [Salinibacterium sp. PAMC 21357]|uniref:DUF937 domain-containing protein n=1 Tax=Salinibacterium sp. PAMC 21357 TaxID=1112215 RepID=UPI0002880EBA|nr:DUF937 domain-containing protein [Salinibacterium sp. PAMC 21357]
MSDLDGLLKLIPIADIAKKLGIDEQLAESAVKQVVPTLIGGMAANAQDDAGAQSLEKALTTHGKKAASTTVNEIDTTDGAKIVTNVFGGKQNDVASAVAKNNSDDNVTSELINKLLPLLAPIVISWVGSRFLGQKTASSTAAESPSSTAGGIGGLLGGLLGNAGGQDLIGGLIGGLLGGGKR